MSAVRNRVARFRGASVIDFDEVEQAPLRPGWVRLRVAVCALCGSDKRLLDSGSEVVPGHEIAGTVIESTTDELSPGSRVIVFIPVFCGACKSCRAGQQNRCLRLSQLIGWQLDGGFADFVDVPAQCALPVPDDIGLDLAVLALDTFGTAAHAVRLGLRTQPGEIENALVVGCGPLGLGVVAVARGLGIETVHAWDPNPDRLALAIGLGAVAAADLDSHNQYQLTAEVSGSAAARELAQRVIEPGGAVLALGESTEPYTMPANPRWRRTDCFTVRSFYFPLTEVADNWDLVRSQGPAMRDTIMTATAPDELPETFARFVAGDVVKPYVTTPLDPNPPLDASTEENSR